MLSQAAQEGTLQCFDLHRATPQEPIGANPQNGIARMWQRAKANLGQGTSQGTSGKT